MNPDGDKSVDRRRFFRLGLSQILRPLAAAAQPLQRTARQLANLDRPAHPAPGRIPLNVWLRPPGALPEEKFRQTCTRGGDCVRVCPAQAIQIDPGGKKGDGLPYIDADADACVVCQGLQCMNVCPSGALVPTSLNDIDMGTAVWWQDSCLRRTGESCTICVDHCPLGSAAIELKNGRVAVNPHGCIGCGVCQHDCPTIPRSITVIPVAAKTA
ncbi:MAG: 4Fe-4S dicluster domain-containing protein [Tepidisphaeraceae bacterium]|jgi:ferredoxin-type protein NapG